MKKTYINPKMEIVEIQVQQLLAGSSSIPTGDIPTNPSNSDAPYFIFEED